ncbi:BTAD domain-containing putative transcriptional regulator [Kitasatospora sp. NPDC049285]|uniref:AfsR/SARP family transcriptional regulator n=1 Tax=Kitasatospora sp. NPDC049285 TaxID=3157096 RepID=UPI00341B098F
MRVLVLGRVELRDTDGRLVELAGAKRRAVLALLAVRLGRVVPLEDFAALLWEGDPPAQFRAVVQGHVAALRKSLNGSQLVLETHSAGYLLRGPADAVDAQEFVELTDQAARAGAEAGQLHRKALHLWRGAALADLPANTARERLAAPLEEARAQTLEAWAAYELARGDGQSMVPLLESAALAQDLREPTVRLLMLCLHQAGRQADALDVYQRTRERLEGEFGIEPGPGLAEALATVLGRSETDGAGPADEPAEFLVPRLLPREPVGFVGRDKECDWLDRVCGARPDRIGVAAVVGPAGIGKSATVVRWARSRSDSFPDGQLFIDLRGFHAGGCVPAEEALARFLVALGVPERQIADDLEGRAARYREETAGRRLLVVLDNAADTENVGPLLPAGSGSAVVVTSRNDLQDLAVAEGAELLTVGTLPRDEALGLLGRLLGQSRVAAESAAADRLIDLCGSVPLALRVAGARLAARPGWALADLVAELDDRATRLRRLDTGGGAGVGAALDLTVAALSPEAARLLALLALHPGQSVDASSAAALLGSSLAVTRRALGALASYYLVTETSPGRYDRHDLIRLYCEELLALACGPREQAERFGALLDGYLAATAQAAGLLAGPHEWVATPAGDSPPTLPRMVDGRRALAWFRAEEPAIRALVERAADTGDHDRAWGIAVNCTALYYGAAPLTDWLRCAQAGARAAERSGQPLGRAVAGTALVLALSESGRADEARPHIDRAVAAAEELGDWYHRTRARLGSAVLNLRLGLTDQALADCDAARRIDRSTPEGSAGIARGLDAECAWLEARVRLRAGEAGAALECAREARETLGDEAAVVSNLYLSILLVEAEALGALGLSVEAERAWMYVVDLCRTAQGAHLLARALQLAGEFFARQGRAEAARDHLLQAAELVRARGNRPLADRLAETVRRLQG